MVNDAEQIFLETLEACHPSRLIEETIDVKDGIISVRDQQWTLENFEAMYVIAVGKASRPMAETLKKKLNLKSSNICCVTPDDHTEKEYCISSSHPLPDEKSKKAGEKLLRFISKIPEDSLIIFAISGGASALICKPVDGIHLQNINTMNQLLLQSGANIHEINGVRKHLSAIKGGQLLNYFKSSCTLIDLVISDVPGNNLEIIGSGPTTPDPSTFQDAYDTLLRYKLWDKCLESIRIHIEKGLTGEAPETVKPGYDPLKVHESYIIGSAQNFAEKAAGAAIKKGYNSWLANSAYNHPVVKIADEIIHKIDEVNKNYEEPVALIFYGESTVEVTGNGKGGRNQELALRGALHIKDMTNVVWLSAGTDGVDGPTDAAGAIVTGDTIEKAEERGLQVLEYLQKNDSYHFHQQMGTLLKTGPTGNNVMDIVLILLMKQRH